MSTKIPDFIPELEEAKAGLYVCPDCDAWTQTLPSHGKCPECLQKWEDGDEYEPLDNILDDEYDVAPTKGGKPINNRMGTLNRVQGMLNRHRNAGRIK